MNENQEDYKLQDRYKWFEIPIEVENKKGSYRSGVDADGKKWKQLMHADYGRIENSKTKADKEEVDVYILSKKIKSVYQISQNKKNKDGSFGGFDEYKYILGASSDQEAKSLYLKQYNDKRFFGGIKEIPFDKFKEEILNHIKNNLSETINYWQKIIQD